MPQAEVLKDLPQHADLVVDTPVAETLLEALRLERSDVGDVDIANQPVLELGGQRLYILPVISQRAFALADLRLDPFLSSDGEQRRSVALSHPVDAEFEI